MDQLVINFNEVNMQPEVVQDFVCVCIVCECVCTHMRVCIRNSGNSGLLRMLALSEQQAEGVEKFVLNCRVHHNLVFRWRQERGYLHLG